MIEENTSIAGRAAELRQAFDRSFAELPKSAEVPTEAFLAMGAGDDFYALRLSEISGLYADKKIVPLPSESTDLLGLTSFRGALIPVYDLNTLLGYSASSMPRWLVLAASKTPVGVSFERFDGYFSAPRDLIAQSGSREHLQSHIREVVHVADQLRLIVSLVSVLEFISRRELITRRAQSGALL